MPVRHSIGIRHASERGVALIAALLILLLMSALMVGFTAVVMSDQRYRGVDRDRLRAFYGAQSGLEKLTVDMGNLFFANVAPSTAQVADLSNHPPTIPDVRFVAPAGVTAYGATLVGSGNGQIQNGPYQGLIALKKYYSLDVVAKTTAGGEAHLTRRMETVAIPVFQFGMFSDVDMAFFAGPDFDFGGRVHTNGNLFLSEGGGNTLTLRDKVTAVGEVVRQRLQNRVSIDVADAHNGTVKMATSTNTFRNLARTEGSVTDGLGSAVNNSWRTISLSTYNGYIRNGQTGARTLNLPLITLGGANTDLIRRPVQNEDVSDPTLFAERDFSRVSLRILLSDTVADIMNLPTIDATRQPVLLDLDWATTVPNNGTAYGPIDATHAPIARSPGTISWNTAANTSAGAATITVAALPVPTPATFHVLKSIDVRNGVGTLLANMNCVSTSSTQFVTCNNTAGGNMPAVAAGSSVNIAVDNVTYTTTTTSAVAAGTNRSYTLTGGTAPLTTNTFWMTCNTGTCVANGQAPSLVTCTGFGSATQFSGCTGVPATNSPAPLGTNALSSQNTGLIGGYIKIEMQNTVGTWRDVTMEILNYGIAGPNVGGGAICADPSPNAIIRLQRLRDNANTCTYAASRDSYDYWPNVLFDPREGLERDATPAAPNASNLPLGGVMHYITLDIGHLAQWFKGNAPYNGGSGVNAMTNNGYSVYFSDRRNNRNALSQETGEYGFEDFVNPTTGAPDGVLDTGEDLNANGVLDVYGQFPSYNGAASTLPPFDAATPATFKAVANVRPWTWMTVAQAKANRAYLFRHALKLVNAGSAAINVATPGLTIAAENPVYVQGDWNANAAGFTDPHIATSIVADSVTLLSGGWSDQESFTNPYAPGNRNRDAAAWYRVAILAGKGMAFPQPTGTATDFGTDGGVHNFLRYLEDGNEAVNFSGSIATFFYNRQGAGTYKCCTTVYGAPTRNYAFDIDFLDPAKLPPLTPVFRDLNSLGFTQELRPGK
jgi:hypothetical protein